MKRNVFASMTSSQVMYYLILKKTLKVKGDLT